MMTPHRRQYDVMCRQGLSLAITGNGNVKSMLLTNNPIGVVVVLSCFLAFISKGAKFTDFQFAFLDD